jgi:WD40 repeat protein
VWSGGQDHTIRVWRSSDGVMTHTLSKHSQYVLRTPHPLVMSLVVYSRDGALTAGGAAVRRKVCSLLAYSNTCVWSGSWDKTIIARVERQHQRTNAGTLHSEVCCTQ